MTLLAYIASEFWQVVIHAVIALMMSVLAFRLANSYADSYSDGLAKQASADWRMFLKAVARAFDPTSQFRFFGAQQVLFAAVLCLSGGALVHAHGLSWGPSLFKYILLWVLGVLALIDLRTGLLINALTYPLAMAGVVLILTGQTVTWANALLAVGLVAAVLFTARALLSRRGSEALGLGDIKTFMAIALWLGVHGVVSVLFWSNVLLLFWSGLSSLRAAQLPREYAFGPFIGLGVALFYVLDAF